MKNFRLGVALGSLLASVPLVYSQQGPEQIYVGTNLQIGMNKDAVISKLTELGYKVTTPQKLENQTEPWKTETWIVTEKNEQTGLYDLLASLEFRNGRLSAANRHWAASWDTGSAKIGRNFYLLVKSLEGSGNTACTLETKLQEGHEFDSKAASIRCGRRTITISVSKYKEQREETVVTETVK